MPSVPSLAVCIGRFQPVHLAHLEMIRRALAMADQVLVVIGSAYRAPTPRNPFTWETRSEMLLQSLNPDERSRVTVLPLRDYFDTDRWSRNLAKIVTNFATDHGIESSNVLLVTRLEQSFVYDHACLASWQHVKLDRFAEIDSSSIRACLFSQAHDNNSNAFSKYAIADLVDLLPSQVLKTIEHWTTQEPFRVLADEWLMLHQYKESWRLAPYTPIFVTADSVVKCRDKVLLVERGKAPGKGLWALPGGFLEPHELIFRSALRELAEETCIDVDAQELESHCKRSFVCDHPNRSERGRIITHAYFFDLGSRILPQVTAADDANHVVWMDISKIAELESQFHDDHFMILDRCLGILVD